MKSLGKFLEKKYTKTSETTQPKNSRGAPSSLVDEKTVFFLAEKILLDEYGKRGASLLRLSLFRDGKLFIRAKSSLWAEEARSFSSTLVERLARDVGDGVVKDIKVSHEYGE